MVEREAPHESLKRLLVKAAEMRLAFENVGLVVPLELDRLFGVLESLEWLAQQMPNATERAFIARRATELSRGIATRLNHRSGTARIRALLGDRQ